MAELFLKIVNMSIAAGWLILVVAVVRLFLKKAPKWVNPLLWGIAGLRLVLPFSIESVLSLIPSAESISPQIMYMDEPVITSGFPVVNEVVNPVMIENLGPQSGNSVNPLQIYISIAAVIWITGIIGMLAYTTVSYFLLRRRVRTSVLLCRNIYQSEQVKTPFVLGILHPRIYLPFRLEEKNIAYVIAHEKSHIQRHDNWTKPLGFLLLTVYWFHPLIWLGYVLFCRDIELACDERVIKEMNHEERADYSQALLNCSTSQRMLSASPLTFSEVDVKERVKRVLTYKKPAFILTVTAICVCVAVAVCFLTNPKTVSGTGENSSSTAVIGGADGPTEIYVKESSGLDEEGLVDKLRENLTAQDFLKEFFSFNKDGRLDTFMREMDLDTYYKNFTPLMTEECRESMEKNRLPMKYEKELSEEYTSVTVEDKDIQLALYADTTYEYTVTMAFNTDEITIHAEITGQITVDDENQRVTNIWVKDSKGFSDVLQGKTLSQTEKQEAEQSEEFYRKWGEIQYAYYQKYEDVRGDYLKEYEHYLQMAAEFYRLKGDENPEASAQEYVTREYALYMAASEEEYAVSDLDVITYLSDMKEEMKNASSAASVMAAEMEAFPSEEEYWNYQSAVYKRKLPVWQYLEDKEKAFAKEKGMETTAPEFADLWEAEKERLIQEAVEKYFSAEGKIDADIVPLEKEEVLAAADEAGLDVMISDSETFSGMPGQITYVLRSPDKTYNNTENKVMFGSVALQADFASGRRLAATFLSVPEDKASDSVFSWDDWKKQLALSAILYGGFDDINEIYDSFYGMEVSEETGFSGEAQLSGGYCQVQWRNSGTSQTQLTVRIFENKAYFDAAEALRKEAAEPFAAKLTSCEISEVSNGEKELSLTVSIENTTGKEWKDVWFEIQFNKEAYRAVPALTTYVSDEMDVTTKEKATDKGSQKNSEKSLVSGFEHTWEMELPADLTEEEIYEAFKEITVTVHALGKKQKAVLPLTW